MLWRMVVTIFHPSMSKFSITLNRTNVVLHRSNKWYLQKGLWGLSFLMVRYWTYSLCHILPQSKCSTNRRTAENQCTGSYSSFLRGMKGPWNSAAPFLNQTLAMSLAMVTEDPQPSPPNPLTIPSCHPWFFNISRDGESTTSQGSPCHLLFYECSQKWPFPKHLFWVQTHKSYLLYPLLQHSSSAPELHLEVLPTSSNFVLIALNNERFFDQMTVRCCCNTARFKINTDSDAHPHIPRRWEVLLGITFNAICARNPIADTNKPTLFQTRNQEHLLALAKSNIIYCKSNIFAPRSSKHIIKKMQQWK